MSTEKKNEKWKIISVQEDCGDAQRFAPGEKQNI
jgi:hypothetical protein